jgi:hypothetical protein
VPQVIELHVAPRAHAWPHAPQFRASFTMSVSHEVELPQLAYPSTQEYGPSNFFSHPTELATHRAAVTSNQAACGTLRTLLTMKDASYRGCAARHTGLDMCVRP